jgi:hypothetical protein
MLTLLRLGFLAVLWALVIITVLVLRRDLRAPRDARPLVAVTVGAGASRPFAPDRPKKKQAKNSPRTLIVVEGPLNGTVIPLGAADITIGRAPDSTLVLDDDYASNNHARISLVDGAWIVQDMGSTNGTWIDKTRLTAPIALTPGRQLKVGRTVLELRR